MILFINVEVSKHHWNYTCLAVPHARVAEVAQRSSVLPKQGYVVLPNELEGGSQNGPHQSVWLALDSDLWRYPEFVPESEKKEEERAEVLTAGWARLEETGETCMSEVRGGGVSVGVQFSRSARSPFPHCVFRFILAQGEEATTSPEHCKLRLAFTEGLISQL